MKTLIASVLVFSSITNFIVCQSSDSIDRSCEDNNCSKCFNTLAYETIKTNENQYNLQLAFFPPDKEAAIFVIVDYHFGDDETKTWFWSASTYHLYQPPEVLQYTSLFFTEPEARSSNLSLTLPNECAEADDKMMQLLTQRLQLFAEKRTIYPAISSNYEPKAESENSLRNYFNNNLHTFRILFSMQFVLWILALLGSPCLIVFLLYGWPYKLKDKIVERVQYNLLPINSTSEHNWWEVRTLLQFITVTSTSIWLYAFIVSMIGLIIQSTSLDPKIKEIHRREHESFRLLYGLTPLIFVENFFTLFISAGIYLALIIRLKKFENAGQSEDGQTKKNPPKFDIRVAGVCFISLPITTFAVHFTHIVIGFIHSPVHATSIGVFYSFVFLASVLLFKTLSSAYYFLIEKDLSLPPEQPPPEQPPPEQPPPEQPPPEQPPPEQPPPEQAPMEPPQLEEKKKLAKCHEIRFFVLYIISHTILLLVFAYVASLYFLLPINRAIDIAPTQLNGFVTTIVFAFGGYIFYHLIKSHEEKEKKKKKKKKEKKCDK